MLYFNLKSFILELLTITAIASAILVIIAKNPVISVIFLISLVLNAALFLILKGMPFIGISYILIYLGAIIVLFLFVIMMINVKLTDILEVGYQYTKNIPLALTVSGIFLYEFFNVLPYYLNTTGVLFGDSIFYSYFKELILTLNNVFIIHIPNIVGINSGQDINVLDQITFNGSMSPLIISYNFPETLIVSYTHIVSVAYSLYTYGAF